MPRLLFLVLASALLITSTANAQHAFPCKATVAVQGTEVLSGPGRSYYPSDKLSLGEILEVYKRDANGLCAVRPPEGSFSWVPARYIKLEDDNLGRVTEEDVGAAVGSRLSSSRDVIQVYLHKNETVEVLGAREMPNDESKIWYKIAPPSGEFRWIPEKYLDLKQPFSTVQNEQSAGSDSAAETTETKAADTITPADFKNELQRIDLDLSMMVVEDPSAWSFNSMRMRADSLLDKAANAEQRGNARLLLNKIARFEDIKQRYDSVAALRQTNALSNRFLDGLQRTMAKAAAYVDPQRRFDGVGQLRQLEPHQFGGPRFALYDQSGQIAYYLTPAPGVNLQKYLGYQIGVTGTRAYMPEQHAQHITARQITPLQNKLR
ncbi:MAG: SH3 domain-containing protein [Thermoguttaceae bacterium]